MTNLFLTDENLKKAIQNAKIDQDQKDALVLKIPELNEEERLKLLDVLKQVVLLDLEETEVLGKIKNNWQ